MSTTPQFTGASRNSRIQFLNGGAPAQIAWPPTPNGSRIHSMTASQDDTQTSLIAIYKAIILTDNARPSAWAPWRTSKALCPILTATKTTNDHIDRTNGSFIQDGWVTGMNCAILNANDNIQNQVIGHVTTVAATTLTYTGTPLNATASAMSAGTILAQVELQWSVSMVSGAGNSGTTPAVDLMSAVNFPSFLPSPDKFLILAPNEFLVIGCSVLPSANKSINVSIEGGDY